jgi:hypothetical protein
MKRVAVNCAANEIAAWPYTSADSSNFAKTLESIVPANYQYKDKASFIPYLSDVLEEWSSNGFDC